MTPALRPKLSGTKTSQIWNLMVAFDRELPMPWDAAVIKGHGSLAWVAVDSSKPERALLFRSFQTSTDLRRSQERQFLNASWSSRPRNGRTGSNGPRKKLGGMHGRTL